MSLTAANLIFPNQLFANHPVLPSSGAVRDTYLIEETLFFNQYPFHKQKLAYHRASMQAYYLALLGKRSPKPDHLPVLTDRQLHYLDAQDERADTQKLIEHLATQGITDIHVVDVEDDYLSRRIQHTADKHGITVHGYDSPLFLDPVDTHHDFFNAKKSARVRYFHRKFYEQQRARLDILVIRDEAGDAKPVGGQWSFDADNRKPYPKDRTPPDWQWADDDKLLASIRSDANDYVETHFADNYGWLNTGRFSTERLNTDQTASQQADLLDTTDSPQTTVNCPVKYPITHEQAQHWLQRFLQTRFAEFGDFEDAIHSEYAHLHHSVITPMLNTGLLTPKQVIDAVLEFGIERDIALNSLEGFIRQVIGWREFMRGLYHFIGTEQRTRNFWGFTRAMPKAFYEARTHLAPIDTVLKRVLTTGYCHHIERLMLFGNVMLLIEIDPDAVYQWFMELFIDAYDWVMVPNVYGMSQFADGGLMATKPYIAGSNYVCKMSDHKRLSAAQKRTWTAEKIRSVTTSDAVFNEMMAGNETDRLPWQLIWDALFWRFMHTHRDFFESQPRLGMLLSHLNKMIDADLNQHLAIAERYVAWLDGGST